MNGTCLHWKLYYSSFICCLWLRCESLTHSALQNGDVGHLFGEMWHFVVLGGLFCFLFLLEYIYSFPVFEVTQFMCLFFPALRFETLNSRWRGRCLVSLTVLSVVETRVHVWIFISLTRKYTKLFSSSLRLALFKPRPLSPFSPPPSLSLFPISGHCTQGFSVSSTDR